MEKNDSGFILLVDDELNVLQSYEITLNSAGIDNLILCSDSRNVGKIIRSNHIELLVLDLTMPHLNGEALLEMVSGDFPEIPVVIITGNMEVETAVNCMKKGAYDYIIKPVDAEKLVSTVHHIIERKSLLNENKLLKDRLLSDEINNTELFKTLHSESPKMKAVFKYSEAIASSPEPILLTGETGVGKELMARTIHLLSGRSGPFVPVCVAGLDENMFSDTLFGHAKGAFTDAGFQRDGLVEKASGGTLFLDEIGDLTQASQIKLLRLIQEKEYYRLGEDLPRNTDTHIITATNQNLNELMRDLTFRKDLYYRLEVHKIHLPPLRERLEDLPLLVDCFIREATSGLGVEKPAIPKELILILRNYLFPGNIRELRSLIYNAVSSHRKGVLSLDSIRKTLRENNSEAGAGYQELVPTNGEMVFPQPLPSLDTMEKLLIRAALSSAGGNQTVAADILGITRQTLNRKLKRI